MRKKIIITLIKFFIFVIIFYACLALNLFHIGEKIVPESKEYLNENIPTEDISIEDEYFSDTQQEENISHFVAETRYEAMLNSLCKRIQVCDKIVLNGEYSIYDKYTYSKAIIRLVDFIGQYGSQKIPIKDVITKVEVNKETGKRRGYATRDTIIMNLGAVRSKTEYAELLTHEMGHIVDLGYIQGNSNKKEKNYTEFGKSVFAINDPSLFFYKISRNSETIRKAETKKKDFCSGYGMSDPFEDFAECFNLYLNHNILFREMAKNNFILKQKYNFIAAIIKGKYIASNTSELNLIKGNTTRRPRDTTKITN
jgi:hypothetical protein